MRDMARTVVGLTTMLRLTDRRRRLLAEKVADIANLITAAVVIGFVIGESTVSAPIVVSVTAAWLTVVGFAIWSVENSQ